MCRVAASLAALVLAVALPLQADARSSDRQQVMHITADRTEYYTSENAPTVLSGNVSLRQGTLVISAARAEISLSGGEMTRSVLTGSPVTLRQQMDDGTPLNVVASRVDYDMQGETAVFTGNVRITQPRGTLNGERVVYNMRSGRIESGGTGGSRVRMTIQPKGAGGAQPAQPDTDGN